MKKILLQFLSVRSYIFISRLRHSMKKSKYPVLNVHDIFEILSRHKKISFIQVGAYDGISNDPVSYFVKKYGWQGILVEPVPSIFKNLVTNYTGTTGLKFENIGIADVAGELDFYFLPEKYADPEWLQQLGTFEKHSIEFNLAHLPEFIPFIQTQKIPTSTLSGIITKHAINTLDVICIDAEGFEYRILKCLPELKVKPQVILFESGSMPKTEYELLTSMLTKMNYDLFISGGDMIAISK